ncbi:hypothetical protein RMATCC62417_03821 [Rhizopus microsporus]|nr:hypothetical protein RMATCC62417_03821 [Rhizopus microsporus]
MLEVIPEIYNLITEVVEQPMLSELVHVFGSTFLIIYSFLLATDGIYFLAFLIAGFVLGGLYFNNTEGRFVIQEYQKTFHEELADTSSTERLELHYRSLTPVIDQLLDYFIRDFIANWWTPLNVYEDVQFEKITREKLNGACMQLEKILMNQDRNDIVMSTLYGVANTLIIHMRECRALEESEISIEDYVRRNPQSPFAQLLSKHEQHQQLRGLSQTLLKRALTGPEKESNLLMSLLRELLATFLFGNILDILSDPDFLNCWIIDLLSDQASSETVQATVSAALETVVSEKIDDDDGFETRQDDELVSFSPGLVHFTVMDISPPQSPDHPLNKSQLTYIIQIERPANEDTVGSEGGGYVITRSYTDFESFHTILSARYIRRINKIQLRLPLDPAKSWLKTQTKKKGEEISHDLEIYLDKVVHDTELGRDPLISAFLRKERRSEVMNDDVVSFSEEYKDQVVAAYALLTDTKPLSRSRSLFSRNNSPKMETKDDTHSMTSSSSTTTEEEEQIIPPKALSSMDVELLIETTYALVIEIFNLTPSNNKAWMRRSILNILREIVRRSYTEFITEQYNDLLNAYMSPDAIMLRLNQLGQQLWPEGQWVVGEQKRPTEKRTDKDREESKRKARTMLMNRVIPSTVRQLIGDQNCNTAMDRIWARCQDPVLNRVLMLQLVERIIKPILG